MHVRKTRRRMRAAEPGTSADRSSRATSTDELKTHAPRAAHRSRQLGAVLHFLLGSHNGHMAIDR